MVGWHHRLDGHEFEQALGVGDGQGSLMCCSPSGRKDSDMTEQLHQTLKEIILKKKKKVKVFNVIQLVFLKETSIKELIGRETCLGKAGKTFKRQLKVNQVNDNKEHKEGEIFRDI